MQYLKFIDGLRAIAVTAVVAYHAGIPGLPGGFVGVDIFFVISGYLITGLLLADLREHDTIRFGPFFARRIRRLMPALMLVLLCSGVIGAFVLYPEELPRLRQSVTAVALIYANFHFLNQAGGYFAPATDLMPLLHTWSLAVEEQYYIVWPLILLAIWNLFRQRDAVQKEKILTTLFAAVFVVSIAACLWWSYRRTELAFYLMPMRAWELMAGGLLVLLQDRVRLTAAWATMLAGAGLIAVLGSILLIDKTLVFPGWVALVPTAGTVAMILGLRCSDQNQAILRAFAWRPVVQIGLLSYSWYLWHWPALALTRAYNLAEKDLFRDLAAALLSLVLAWLTYRFVENPIRFQRPWLFAKPRGTFIAGLIMTVISVSIVMTALDVSKKETKAMVAEWKTATGDVESQKRCTIETLEQALALTNECTFGDTSAPLHSVVWGDSHAGSLSTAAGAIANATNQRILLQSASGCPPLPDITLLEDRGEWDFRCTKINDLVQKKLDLLITRGLRNVILSSRWASYPANYSTDPGAERRTSVLPRSAYEDESKRSKIRFGKAPADRESSLQAMSTSLDQNLARLLAAGVNVVIVAPTPELSFNPLYCAFRKKEESCVIPRAKVDERRAGVMKILKDVVATHPSVSLFDPIDTFCDATTCYAFRDGMALYLDDDHISHAVARSLAPSLQALLR